ncbi:hypothetical protein IEE92_13320 [Kocuria sp. cx-116]|uniref:hypothetical protein n=1 Tax=Kocuria sp. cx-116 TaxID=2771378 RepID=UPI0016841581|nr:hypothetical protein [Kocuria sp. cx-116]MBD2763509.1 hypothetical protein [Kocuria sp. cx-116]
MLHAQYAHQPGFDQAQFFYGIQNSPSLRQPARKIVSGDQRVMGMLAYPIMEVSENKAAMYKSFEIPSLLRQPKSQLPPGIHGPLVVVTEGSDVVIHHFCPVLHLAHC